MNKIKLALGLLPLLAVLFVSCNNNIFNQNVPPPPEVEAGMGRVNIGFGAADCDASRALFPNISFDSFRYFFRLEGWEDHKEKEPEEDEYDRLLFTLEAGAWNVIVHAYVLVIEDDEEELHLAAQGSANFTLDADSHEEVRVGLVATEDEGYGTFSWHIVFPPQARVVNFTLRRMTPLGLTQSIELTPYDNAPDNSLVGSIEVPAGFWQLNIELVMDTFNYTGRTMVVHIYDLFTTEYGTPNDPIVFDESHFTFGDLVLTQARWESILRDIANDANFDGTLDLSRFLPSTVTTGAGLRYDGTFYPWVTGHAAAKARVTSLILPDEATSIVVSEAWQLSPFEEFATLAEVSGSGVITIGALAFLGASSLETVCFPRARTIGDSAFSSATSLETVCFPRARTIGDSAFVWATSLTEARFLLAETIGNNAFSSASSLETVYFPEVRNIGNSAFSEATSLTYVHIPQVASLGNNVFAFTGSTPLTITMGATPPQPLGRSIFQPPWSESMPKTVTVRVPYPAAYTTYLPNWVDGFRGRGLYDGNFPAQSVSLNDNVSVYFVRLED